MSTFDAWLAWLGSAGKGPLALYASRGRPFSQEITIPGNYAGATLRGDVRLYPDAAGDPLATFTAGAAMVAGGNTTFTLYLGGEDTAALPASPDDEYTVEFAYDLLLKPVGGYEQLYKGGNFVLLGRVTESAAVAGAALFDTAGDYDFFTDLIYTPHASLTVTASQVAFSSSGATDQILTIAGPDGVTPLYFCFDRWTIDATFTVTSFPAAGVNGVRVGGRFYQPAVADGVWGMLIASHGGAATTALISAITNDTILEATHSEAGLPKTIRVRYRHDLPNNLVTHTVNVNAGADIQLTQPYGAGSFGGPTQMLSGVLRFLRGVSTCTALKLTADYPGARFAFVGDSLTVGASAVPITDGFAHRVRGNYPDQVLIAGASGSTTPDWEDMVHSVVRMRPKTAIICLGTNDRIAALSVAVSQAAMTNIVNALIAEGIEPVLLSSPPINNANVPTFNTWLDAQTWRYVDIYTPLLGTGTALAAAYNSGDGVHWNDAGHDVVYDIVTAYLVAEGL